MATLFSGTLNPNASNSEIVALTAPANGIALLLTSDQAAELTVQVSLDGGTTFADLQITGFDLPLPASTYRSVNCQGATNAKVTVFNNSDVVANVVLEGVTVTF